MRENKFYLFGGLLVIALCLLAAALSASWEQFKAATNDLVSFFTILLKVAGIVLVAALAVLLGIRLWTLWQRRHAHVIKPGRYGPSQVVIDSRNGLMYLLPIGKGKGARIPEVPATPVVSGPVISQARASSIQVLPGPQATAVMPPANDLALPGPCDFADLLRRWRPSPQSILVALGPNGRPITVPVRDLCHVAFAGPTGGGKSLLAALLASQLESVGANVLFADPHFAPILEETDWRLIAEHLVRPPATTPQAIHKLLSWMALVELPARIERRRQGKPLGASYFLFCDEWPVIVDAVPDAPKLAAKILREGRKFGLNLLTAAQDFLVKTIGGSGGVRDCFRTAYYTGGDRTTAKVLLDVKDGEIDDGTLGKGVVMLRCTATPEATLVRVPLPSIDAIRLLLPPVTSSFTTPRSGALADSEEDEEGEPEAESEDATPSPLRLALDARSLRVLKLFRQGLTFSEVIQTEWQVPKRGGDAYIRASRELSEILSKIAQYLPVEEGA